MEVGQGGNQRRGLGAGGTGRLANTGRLVYLLWGLLWVNSGDTHSLDDRQSVLKVITRK
jgi:hypothetical protein